MIGMKFWLRKWLEHHAAHLICGEHVERSAEDWHISQNLGSNVSTQSSTNLCSARDLCSVCSPVSNNVQHPMLLQPDITYGIILIHTICSLWMCRAGITMKFYELRILWIAMIYWYLCSSIVCFSWKFVVFVGCLLPHAAACSASDRLWALCPLLRRE